MKIYYLLDSNEYLISLKAFQNDWKKHYKELKADSKELTMDFILEKAYKAYGDPVAIDEKGNFYWIATRK